MVNYAPFLSVTGVGRTFGAGDAQVVALTDVDVEIASGEFTVILGPSGSGKSTLLNLLGGMDRPSTGSIRVDGEPIETLSDRDLTGYRRERVGFVFQFYNLIPNLTAVENVALAASLVMPRREAADIATDLLERVGLGHRLDQFPRHLSGGEMQRVAIARALAKRPGLLLCDEPSGALDTVTGTQVLAQLQETARSTETAVVVVTHEHTLAEAADRLISLRDGRVVENRRNETPETITVREVAS
ncbi:ABC transporter ATP-binding protein [Auritidibacter ignavus]|uniref:ABC transporter ATP-binding protein n=1 Tax=Auritidibacter TaxID=1160973 RepID=UPI000D73C646|nr:MULTISPECIES: ABC transporter ATP-binding protein [Auritidibacter]AXR74845.1 ABC transporter ATP-binding protein [Auritidibacter sp. NML130574]PXA78562.1 macrolide ABC transporter ATP-binding protein [Auritidibacter sp. NML120779]WGH81389.1 ABC transporter ATP-binding protein [Auritidibacter ignavus]WHS35573.1 ABC transporter ATP-binding protein [Auritidibacter ignavus]